MYLTQRKWHHVPAQFQRLSAFAMIAVLAFSVGWAAGTYGPAAYTFVTTNRNAAPAAAPASGLRIPNSVAQAPAVAPAVVAPQPQAQRYLLGGHGELVVGASNTQAARQPQARRYLLGGHGELVAGASNVQAPAHITAASPALIGTGSAYDGMPYRAASTRPMIATCRGSYPVAEGQHIMYRPRCQ